MFDFKEKGNPRLCTTYHPIELNENRTPYTATTLIAFGVLYFAKWKKTGIPRGTRAIADTTLAVLASIGWAEFMVSAPKSAALLNNEKEWKIEENTKLGGAPPFSLKNI